MFIDGKGYRMELHLKIMDQNQQTDRTIESGELLLTILQEVNSTIHAPCGGKGTCKKCKVEIEGVGEVLACQTRLDERLCRKDSNEIVVILPDQGKAKIQSGGVMPAFVLDPVLQIRTDSFPKPSIKDQAADDQRVMDQTNCQVPFHLLPVLPDALREKDYQLRYLVRKDRNEITNFLTGTAPVKFYGVAIDIGTTTVAAYLYNLATGVLIKTVSCLNPQRGYGADVISRIDFASKSKENLKQLQQVIGEKVVDLLFDLAESIQDVSLLSIAGNTTMLHLLCGIDPEAIASAPFIPATIQHQIRYAKELFPFFPNELEYNPVCILLPSISGYVGADIVAGILTCQMDIDPKVQILIDIGTNGEIALSNKGEIVACSTAAGPAFEGANITCGMGGVSGAIDKVFFENGEITYSTIMDEPACGICGSGIVAAVAALLHAGVIDETGRFEEDLDLIPATLHQNIRKIRNDTLYVFSNNDEGLPQVYLNQKDIREVQNAKAAVCAGIRLLMERQKIRPDDVDHVYIAGGFGNFLNIEDAFTIGLLPGELKGKAKMVGNTSGLGASLCLLDVGMIARCDAIQKKTEYYELSSDKRFTDLYIDAMLFDEGGMLL